MSKDSKQDALLAWLKDAHALELNAVQTYQNHSKDAGEKGYAELQRRLEQHLEESRSHAEQVEACIKRLGGSTSTAKDALGAVSGFFQARGSGLAADEVVKNALGDYAAESFEIASYRSLVAAARALGDEQTANVCETILQEEERMADFLREQIPVVTRGYLERVSA